MTCDFVETNLQLKILHPFELTVLVSKVLVLTVWCALRWRQGNLQKIAHKWEVRDITSRVNY